jgi:hypothetical protein
MIHQLNEPTTENLGKNPCNRVAFAPACDTCTNSTEPNRWVTHVVKGRKKTDIGRDEALYSAIFAEKCPLRWSLRVRVRVQTEVCRKYE